MYDWVEYSKSESGPPGQYLQLAWNEKMEVADRRGVMDACQALINSPAYQCTCTTLSKHTHTQIFPVMATCGHRCGIHMTATTATPEAVRTGLARSQPRSRSFHSSGTPASTSVKRGIALNPNFRAYFVRKTLMFGTAGGDVDVDADSYASIRSLTTADTQRRWSGA